MSTIDADPTAPPPAGPAAGAPADGPAALRPETRARRTERVNRTVLLLIGLLLTAAGAAGVAAAAQLFGTRISRQPVLAPGTRDLASGSPWFWPAVAGAGAVLALLCLWWLLVQGRTDRVGHLELSRDPSGHIDLDAGALTGALTAEVQGYHGVTGGRAHLAGSSSAPRLSVTVQLDGRTPPDQLHERLTRQALAHARTALDQPDLPARVELVLPRRPRRDVR